MNQRGLYVVSESETIELSASVTSAIMGAAIRDKGVWTGEYYLRYGRTVIPLPSLPGQKMIKRGD